MTKALRVAFFGASVTEQSYHHVTNEVTGYVTYFANVFAPQRNYQVFRVSAGSCNITDAAIVYAKKVIELQPDICVLDWATTDITDCDNRFVDQVYNILVSHRIIVLTTIFPRRDRVQSKVALVDKMRHLSKKFGMPFYDISSIVGDEELLGILRDVVHTSASGAKRYAELLDNFISTLDVTAYRFRFEPLPFSVQEIASAANVPLSAKQIVVSAASGALDQIEYCVMLEQRIGPYSPVLEVSSDDEGESHPLENFSVWDPWCYRERQCLKPLMGWASGRLSRLTIKVSKQDPDYAKSNEPTHADAGSRHLKPRGALYLVSTRPINCSARFL